VQGMAERLFALPESRLAKVSLLVVFAVRAGEDRFSRRIFFIPDRSSEIRRRLWLEPIFETKSGHALEFSHVIGHDG
jgi:hypothetical protein